VGFFFFSEWEEVPHLILCGNFLPRIVVCGGGFLFVLYCIFFVSEKHGEIWKYSPSVGKSLLGARYSPLDKTSCTTKNRFRDHIACLSQLDGTLALHKGFRPLPRGLCSVELIGNMKVMTWSSRGWREHKHDDFLRLSHGCLCAAPV